MTAPPTFFVGLLPPTPLSARVLAWQRGLEHVITPPHVTLKAPGHFGEEVMGAFEEVCRRVSPFEVTLGRVQTFPDRAIYLEVAGTGLGALHAGLVAAAGRPPGAFELEGYHPHLTLALHWRPLRLGWPGALAAARAAFADLEGAPLRFTAREAALFRKEKPGELYYEAARWPFGTQRG